MKRIITIGLSSVLILPVIFVAIATAEDSTSTQPTTTETSESELPKPDDSRLLERLEKRKTALKTRLTNLESAHIKSKCVASQGRVSSVRGRIKGIETSRTNVHRNIIGHLSELSTKLKNKGVDTTTLDADIAVLQAKIETFNADLVIYKQDVTDLEALDCKADPDAFQASLLASRTALEKVKQDATDIRSYIKDTIKPLLQTIRAELETQQPEETTTEGGQ